MLIYLTSSDFCVCKILWAINVPESSRCWQHHSNYWITARLFHILQDIPCDEFALLFKKKMSTENVLSVLKYTIIHHFQVGSDIANQKSYHDEKSTLQCFTRVICPRLIRNVRSHRRFDCSSSIIAHPVNFDIDRERSSKCDADNSTYIYIEIDITFSIIDMDFLYQFSLTLHHFFEVSSIL